MRRVRDTPPQSALPWKERKKTCAKLSLRYRLDRDESSAGDDVLTKEPAWMRLPPRSGNEAQRDPVRGGGANVAHS